MGGAAGGAAAAAAAIAAIKASGAIVRVEPGAFQQLLERQPEPLVVHAESAFGSHRYLTSYKGLCFFTKSRSEVFLPGDAEVVEAERIWTP